ncbi:MAG: helix-turn-helix transcriptional regulator [Geothrix sp.]|uniref:ArsR/SmtB family transcription factor n=1 Tax=Geothrix sp. TaxID=1962974 RepID=UPI00185536C4|nr:metalloregulator ArsR/SmtB family transcription factor [Geothrix sp.]NWJ41773.1 helix-turn-helix transcriptional regulator [Geothrix sp.]WIL20249.1 MAG: metalloregulator ArsR/SmtB family transcription factor [Geothrix sp.]
MSRAEALSPARVKDAAPLFAALGDATRLGLLVTLCSSGPLSVTRLGSRFAVSRQALTKHLDVLAASGLVRSSRQGRERIWELEPRRLGDAHAYLERLSRQWDDALGRLKAFVERG